MTLSRLIEELLIEAAPTNVRPAPVLSEPTRPRPAPEPRAREPVAHPGPRCPICGEWVGSAFRRLQKPTRWVNGVEYHRRCLGDGQ